MKRSGESCYRCTVETCSAKLFISASDVVREGVALHKHRKQLMTINFNDFGASQQYLDKISAWQKQRTTLTVSALEHI